MDTYCLSFCSKSVSARLSSAPCCLNALLSGSPSLFLVATCVWTLGVGRIRMNLEPSAPGDTSRIFMRSDIPGWPHKAVWVSYTACAAIYRYWYLVLPVTLNSPFIWMQLTVHSPYLTWWSILRFSKLRSSQPQVKVQYLNSQHSLFLPTFLLRKWMHWCANVLLWSVSMSLFIQLTLKTPTMYMTYR